MKVLSVASEIYPLIKTGGLADVTGALPLAMATYGIETKTLIPGYPAVMRVIDAPVERVHLPDLLGVEARILESRYMGLDLLILDAPTLFDRDGGPYLDPAGRDYEDNWLRFAALSRAGADIAAGAMPGWRPDIVHAHDWQAAMTPVFMRYSEALEIPSVMTIHNIAFQGQFGSQIFPGLRLPPHAYSTQSIEYYGDINYLKGGIETCWAVTTVSPSYADEILTPEFGMGLEGVIAGRANALHGIVNGIDTTVWDPSNDGLVVSNYTVDTIKSRKPNREAVVAHFNLDSDPGPIFCVISRLTWQKGMDVLAETVDQIVAMGAKLIILGSGESALEAMLSEQAARYPGRVSISVGYNEGLSHLMQAGSDAILIPSRFEPCGLTQLYALRYGCVPVVARIGGLADTVIDANPAAISANAATGVQFSPVTAEGLLQGIRRTVRLHADQKLWTELQKQGMKSEVSWDGSAARYAALYSGLVSKGI